jgi:hypothetical protein
MRRTPALVVIPALLLIAAPLACRDNESRGSQNERDPAASLSSGAPVIDSIANPTAPGSAEPNLAVGPDGRVYLSWFEAADSAQALRFATHDGQTWSAPRTIREGRDFFVNWADFPSLAVMPDGRLLAHWLQRTGKSTYAYGVRVSQSRDGGATWSTPAVLHGDSSDTEHGFVSMWADNGTTGAVWLDGRKYSKAGHNPANEMMLMTASIDAFGKPAGETTLDARTCDCCQTAAAMTTNGPVVVYRDRTSAEIRDIYVVRRVGTAWSEPMPVHNDGWNIAACPVNGPSISARGTRVGVAWFTAANDSARVQFAFSDDGAARFGAPVRVDDGNPAGRVGTVLLDDGSALVTWIERTGGDTASVRARRIATDGTRGASVTIAMSSAARASGFPRVALTKTHALFAWTQPGTPSAVRTARVALTAFP